MSAHPEVVAPPAPVRRGSRHVRLAGVAVGVIAALVVAAAAVWVSHLMDGGSAAKPDAAQLQASKVPASWQRPAVVADALAERSGVKITQVAITGQGGLVDLRYQVIDPDKAAALHDRATPPALVDEKTGLVVSELFMNHSHSGAFKAGVTYYLIFNDPGNWVVRGSRVTVLLGNAEVEHVVVR